MIETTPGEARLTCAASTAWVLEVQWQNIKGNGVDQFRDTNIEVILEPIEYRTGTVIAPYKGGVGE